MTSLLLFLLFISRPAASDEANIRQIPVGSTVTVKGIASTIQMDSYLLPGPYYDQALVAARQLEVCRPALVACQDSALALSTRVQDALKACVEQYDADDTSMEDLRVKWQTELMARTSAEARLREVRGQRNLAWGITGGLVFGAVITTAVVLGN